MNGLFPGTSNDIFIVCWVVGQIDVCFLSKWSPKLFKHNTAKFKHPSKSNDIYSVNLVISDVNGFHSKPYSKIR